MLKDITRIFRFLPASLVAAGVGLAALDALAVEPNLVRVRRVQVPAQCCSERMEGLKLAHLSDLHVMGRGWRPGTISRAIQACNGADVDLVAITGDFIGGDHGAFVAVQMLSALRTDVPRMAVLGNHDHVYGKRHLDILLGGLRELGILVLCNESLPLELPSGHLWVAGVDDGYTTRDDLGAALRPLGPDDFPRIVLTHYPEVAEYLRPGQVQLSLAGHSHAGQIRVPVLATMMHNAHARTKYGKGLFMVNGNPLYVSAGVGMSGIPMRFRNPPEVVLIGFKAAPSTGPGSVTSADRQTRAARRVVPSRDVTMASRNGAGRARLHPVESLHILPWRPA